MDAAGFYTQQPCSLALLVPAVSHFQLESADNVSLSFSLMSLLLIFFSCRIAVIESLLNSSKFSGHRCLDLDPTRSNLSLSVKDAAGCEKSLSNQEFLFLIL